ncbi:MAG TPA: hypothetical protein DEW97_02225 [Sutterella wadsworthensis]|nr:hypothetical protein [Sutterella wadsworthensis]HCG92404.1 hypothetical protein [Sutterella wadsworthensis]
MRKLYAAALLNNETVPVFTLKPGIFFFGETLEANSLPSVAESSIDLLMRYDAAVRNEYPMSDIGMPAIHPY